MLLIARTTCCCRSAQGDTCGLCEEKERIWMLGENGCDNVVRSFIDFVVDEAERADKKKGKVLVYAHNRRGYDCHFILRELVNSGYKELRPLVSGAKIIKLSLGNIHFVDSLSLFQLPLKSLPKAFGLGEGIEKLDFPHLLNVEGMIGQTIDWPDEKYYELGKRSRKEAATLRTTSMK